MQEEQQKKAEEIERKGHEANPDNGELEAMEPIGDADDAEGEGPAETDLPDEVDDVEENLFPSAE